MFRERGKKGFARPSSRWIVQGRTKGTRRIKRQPLIPYNLHCGFLKRFENEKKGEKEMKRGEHCRSLFYACPFTKDGQRDVFLSCNAKEAVQEGGWGSFVVEREVKFKLTQVKFCWGRFADRFNRPQVLSSWLDAIKKQTPTINDNKPCPQPSSLYRCVSFYERMECPDRNWTIHWRSNLKE